MAYDIQLMVHNNGEEMNEWNEQIEMIVSSDALFLYRKYQHAIDLCLSCSQI